MTAALAWFVLPAGPASAFSFGPDLTVATPDNTATCSLAGAIYGCTAADVVTSSMSLYLPDPFFNGNQTGVVTALHVLSARTAPAQFVVIEESAHRGVTGSVFPSGILAVSEPVTLHPGINNFNTNLPVDYRWSPSSGFDSWSIVGMNILDGTSPVPGWLEAPPLIATGLGGETGLLLDCGSTPACPSPVSPNPPLPFTTAVADITVAPHYAQISGFVPMRLLLSGEVTNTTGLGGGGGGQVGGGGGAVVPVLAKLALNPTAFRAAATGPTVIAAKAKPKPGTLISYSDSQAARTTFTVLQSRSGVRQGKRCVAPPKRPKGKPKRCTRTVPLGSFAHADRAGTNRLRFTGRLRGRKLAPGAYQLSAVAKSTTGKTGAPNTRRFRINP